jgi:hypothetical protein
MNDLGLDTFLLPLLLILLGGASWWWSSRLDAKMNAEFVAKRKAEELASEERRKREREQAREQSEAKYAAYVANLIEELREALAKPDFREADELTHYIVGPKSDAETLRAVDKLWSDASGGKFGLVVQARLAPLPEKCFELAGIPSWWSWGGRTYDLSAPRGHLPIEWLYGEWMPFDGEEDRAVQPGHIRDVRETLRILTFENYLPG